MASHQKTKAGRSRGLENSGAGNKEERSVWRPAVLSPIPQLDGSTTPPSPETTTTPPDTAPRPPDTSTTPPDTSTTSRDSPITPNQKEMNPCEHMENHYNYRTKGFSCHSCKKKLLD